MKAIKILLCVLSILCCYVVDLSAQITSNVYVRVLKIKVGDTMGTSFTMDIDGRQYLITAKHIVKNLNQEGSIEIDKNNQWSPISVKVLKCLDPIDIAVLIPPKVLTPTYPLEPISDSRKIIIGQDAYFAGFPLGISMDPSGVNLDHSLAIVKKGIVSAQINEKGAIIYLIDGFNNHGFSGGPIVFRNVSDLNPNSPLYLLGVVSGFPKDLSPVMTPEKVREDQDTSNVEQWRIVRLKDGQKAILRDTDQVVNLNPGIVIGYGIKHAIDLIRKNPLGPKIEQ